MDRRTLNLMAKQHDDQVVYRRVLCATYSTIDEKLIDDALKKGWDYATKRYGSAIECAKKGGAPAFVQAMTAKNLLMYRKATRYLRGRIMKEEYDATKD